MKLDWKNDAADGGMCTKKKERRTCEVGEVRVGLFTGGS